MKFFYNNKITTLFFAVSITLLIYVFYKSEIIHAGNKRLYYAQYYVLSLTFIILSLVSFFLDKNKKINLILILISFFFSFYLIEGIIINKYFFYKKFDLRDRYQVYKDLKKVNKNIILTIDPHNYIKKKNLDFFPLSGISNLETIHCNENGYYSIYQSDRYGFNNPDSEWEKKEIDYILVGDSFLHGACVNRPNDVSGVLRKHYKKNVLNLGYSGSGPLIEHATLREYFPKLKVKNIIWVYFEGNDQTDLINELNNSILKKYITDVNFNQNLISKQTYINKLNEIHFEKELIKTKKERIINFFKLGNLRNIIQPVKGYKEKSVTIQPKPSKEFIKILKFSKKLAEKNNSNFYFLYLPDFFRYSEIKSDDNDYKKNEIIKIINELNINLLDFHSEIFSKTSNPKSFFPYEKNNHYTPEGYKILAKYIFDKTN